ncbi:HlyD family secretion protein [Cystobacter fuscus]
MNPTSSPTLPSLPAMRLVRHSTRVARTVARVLMLTLLLGVLALLVAPWQQNITGHGRVTAYAPLERQQTLQAPVAGRITRWAVQEGSRVKEGELLVELSDNDPELMTRLQEQRGAIEARISAAQSQMLAYESRVDALRSSRLASVDAAGSRVRMVRERIRSAEQSLAAAEVARETARLNLERQRTLHKDGLTATRALEVAQLEYTKAGTDTESARASLNSARNELAAISSERQRIQTDADALVNDGLAKHEYAKAELAKERIELAKLDSMLARQSTQQIRAPRAGTLLRLMPRQGAEVVKVGDPLAVLVPDTDSLAVELHVPGRDAPLVSPGRHVRLQFEGWPAVQFAGWPSVAVGTLAARWPSWTPRTTAGVASASSSCRTRGRRGPRAASCARACAPMGGSSWTRSAWVTRCGASSTASPSIATSEPDAAGKDTSGGKASAGGAS